jgi:hypothetical protein
MTNVSSSSASHSDTALRTVPQKSGHYNSKDERTFLAQQATDAKTAMQRTIQDMQATAKEVANIPWWTQQYPWYAVGAAAVIGFMTATRVLLPPDQHAPAPPPQAPAVQPSLMGSLFEMLRSTLVSAIIGAIHTSSQKSEPEQQVPVDPSYIP